MGTLALLLSIDTDKENKSNLREERVLLLQVVLNE